jgi:hypothetical protein
MHIPHPGRNLGKFNMSSVEIKKWSFVGDASTAEGFESQPRIHFDFRFEDGRKLLLE